MDNYELLLSKEAEDNVKGAIDTLVEAAHDIATKSEQDFERIKEKKWYKRLWELVTFSKDNEKIQARGVVNLAKLNEIVMKAIVLLSKQSKNNADRIYEALQEIKSLSEEVDDLSAQQEIIANKILIIRRGFESEGRFDELSDNQRAIICAVLDRFSEIGSNEHTQDLMATVYKSARRTYDEVTYRIIEKELNTSAQKWLFNLLHGYSLLLTNEMADEKHDAFRHFPLSDETKENIRKAVKIDVNQRLGIGNYIRLFEVQTTSEDNFVVENDIDWFFDNGELENETVVPEIEVLNINNMVHIVRGTTMTYQYKEIHLNSLINCCGTLQFDECIIVYNENENSDEIILSDGAEIYATNCVFRCKNIDKNYFISLSDNCTASFDKCVFLDCSYFLISDKNNSTLSITNSEFYNCAEFIKHGYYAGSFQLTNAKITMDNNCKYDFKYDHSCMFKIECKEALVDNVVATSTISLIPALFEIENGTVMNSSFEGIRGDIISSQIVENCVFENCFGNFHLISNFCFYNGEKHIKSCVFENCTKIAMVDSDTVISQCKFINCANELIYSATAGKGIEIIYCEFINYKNTAIDDQQGKETSDPVSAIKLYAEKHNTSSVIKKSVFDGVDINEGFLISPSILGKISGNTIKVSDCDFRNCSTKRQSGKIIKTYGWYFNLFDSVKNELAISVVNCRGLDKVKQNGTGVCSDDKVLTSIKTAKSNIGAKAIGMAGIGIVGGPLAMAGVAVINAIADKQKKKDEELSEQASKE